MYSNSDLKKLGQQIHEILKKEPGLSHYEISQRLNGEQNSLDLNNLRRLSENGDIEIAENLRKYCNPPKVALELLSNLENRATQEAKKGKREAYASIELYYYQYFHRVSAYLPYSPPNVTKSGLLLGIVDGKWDSMENTFEVFKNMVASYVNNDNIEIFVNKSVYGTSSTDYTKSYYLTAKISW